MPTDARWCRCPPAAWSRRSSPSCAPAPACGSRTAPAPRIARRWIASTTFACRRTILPTPCAACGSPMSRNRGTTTAFPTRGFGRCAIWRTCGRRFAPSDWRAYEEVNAKFADVVAAEASTDSPVVLIQDFHFALLPKLIRLKIPKATIALFWHIPWPNAETFGVCPWKREMLLHMLSADILGFHTRYHCQNFLDTVDRFVECQIDREHMTVTLQGHVCRVAAYPISIEWPPRWLKDLPDVAACRAAVRERYRIGAGRGHRLGSRALGLHQGNHRALPGARGAARQEPAASRANHSAADRLAVARPAARLPGAAGANLPRGGAHQRQVRRGRLAADRADRRAPRAAQRLRAVPRRRFLPGQQSARRHESGGEGIRGRARR